MASLMYEDIDTIVSDIEQDDVLAVVLGRFTTFFNVRKGKNWDFAVEVDEAIQRYMRIFVNTYHPGMFAIVVVFLDLVGKGEVNDDQQADAKIDGTSRIPGYVL
ncbi:MAG: hypothetical protein Q9218_000721 [Villophora microphyllina]